MATSPTQLTLKNMRGRGYYSAVVEHWNSFIHKRQDLYGIIDVLGVGEEGTLAVQSTDITNMSKRVTKINESESISHILKAGWKVEVHGWRKVKNRWQVKIVVVTDESYQRAREG